MQKKRVIAPGIPAIFQVGLATRHNVLDTFRLETERASRRGREGPFAEVLFCSQSVV